MLNEAQNKSNPVRRFLASPVWDGVSGLLAILGFVLSWSALSELLTGNVQLLLWLHAVEYAIPISVFILTVIFTVAFFVVFSWRKVEHIDLIDNEVHVLRVKRFPSRSRRLAVVLGISSLLLMLIITAGFNHWSSRSADEALVLVADFNDTTGRDSMAVTRQLVTRIGDTLAEYPDIQVRPLGWPIEDLRGEGSVDAHRIGRLAKAAIVIWGDYQTSPETVMFVHFEQINMTPNVLATKAYQVFGDQSIQDAATRQLSLPPTVAFNVTLGEQLGSLVALAAGIALLDKGAFEQAAQFIDTANKLNDNPLASDLTLFLRKTKDFLFDNANRRHFYSIVVSLSERIPVSSEQLL